MQYQLALVSAAHGVPFYVAASFTTLDINLSCSKEIEIEKQPPEEFIQTSCALTNLINSLES